ncbi:hypothetical protein DdX_00832 [Ditylenchus destructor]|uniref:Uncharacterized protein n=1 Tax=Ditylenchus destructor TaxID=166010 RepID=A0AAD4NKR3_9BILA|nr:hypothetical protein DdX_00832 [Ditylenchus destructor]
METNAQVIEKEQVSKNKIEIVACLYSDMNFVNRITDEIMAVSSDLSANEFASELLSKFRDYIFLTDSKYLMIRKLNTKFNHFLTLKTDQKDFLEDGNVFNICSFPKNVGQTESVLFPIDKLLQMMPLETVSDTDFRIQPEVSDSKPTMTSNQNDNVSSLDQNASTTDTPNSGENPHLWSLLLPKPAAEGGIAKLDEIIPKEYTKDDNFNINPIDNKSVSPDKSTKGVSAFNTSMSGKGLYFPSMIPTINPVHHDNAPSLQFSYAHPLQAHTTPKSDILPRKIYHTENTPPNGLEQSLSNEIPRDDSIYSLIEPWMSESVSKQPVKSFSPTGESMKSSDNVNMAQRLSPKSRELYSERKNGHIPQKLSSVRVMMPGGETDNRSGEKCNFRNPNKPQEGYKNENIRGKSSTPSSRQLKQFTTNTSSLSRSPSVIISQQHQFPLRENRRSYGPRRSHIQRGYGTQPGSFSNERRSENYGASDNCRGKNPREFKQLDSSIRFPASTIAHLKSNANTSTDDTDDKGSLSSGEIVD